MRLTVVGCSGSYPGPDSPASCYLVEADQDGRTLRMLLDLGSGALGRLHRHADPLSIAGVFTSHLHPDHFIEAVGRRTRGCASRSGRPRRAETRCPRYSNRQDQLCRYSAEAAARQDEL